MFDATNRHLTCQDFQSPYILLELKISILAFYRTYNFENQTIDTGPIFKIQSSGASLYAAKSMIQTWLLNPNMKS